MMAMADISYFRDREQACLRLAEAARDQSARSAHLTLAAAYRRRIECPETQPQVLAR